MSKRKRYQLLSAMALALIGSLLWRFTHHVDRESPAISAPSNESISTFKSAAENGLTEKGPYAKLRKQATLTSPQREAMRRQNWKQRFPWKPTTDPNVVISKEALDSRLNLPIKANHGFLRAFFENEARFSRQFEQLYDILEEHGRADNPVAAGQLFQNLWLYHQAQRHNPETLKTHSPNPWTPAEPVIDRVTGKPTTWGEAPESLADGLVYHLAAERKWPNKETMSQQEAFLIRDRLISEISDVEAMPDPKFAYHSRFEQELEAGDSPLVPSVGWQEAYDQWEANVASTRPSTRQEISANNELLNREGQPIVVGEGERVIAALVTPDGQQIPLSRGDDGRILIPTPKEIEVLNEQMNGANRSNLRQVGDGSK